MEDPLKNYRENRCATTSIYVNPLSLHEFFFRDTAFSITDVAFAAVSPKAMSGHVLYRNESSISPHQPAVIVTDSDHISSAGTVIQISQNCS